MNPQGKSTVHSRDIVQSPQTIDHDPEHSNDYSPLEKHSKAVCSPCIGLQFWSAFPGPKARVTIGNLDQRGRFQQTNSKCGLLTLV